MSRQQGTIRKAKVLFRLVFLFLTETLDTSLPSARGLLKTGCVAVILEVIKNAAALPNGRSATQFSSGIC
jgi:hypothetical protein